MITKIRSILGFCRSPVSFMPAASLRSQLLRSAVPLVKDYGFTREALARSVLANNDTSLKEHKEPLSEYALDALFGTGNDARRTLIHAWLDEGLAEMRKQTGEQRQLDTSATLTLRQVLHARLAYNEPALPHIPEVTLSPYFSFIVNKLSVRRLRSSSCLRPAFTL